MKLLRILLLCLIINQVSAQEFEMIDSPRNELSLNAFELILGGVLPINYERYLKNNQSLAFKTFLFDKHYNDITEADYGTFSLQTQYVIYFSEKRDHAGLYTAPFFKFTTGTGTYNYYDYSPANPNGQQRDISYAVNAFVAGFEVGYKFVVKRNFTFALAADLGRVLNQGDYYGYGYGYDGIQNFTFDEYGPVEFRFGVNMGYRF